MNRKKKPTEEVKMSTWEVFRRLVRDARPIYGWLLLGALLGGIDPIPDGQDQQRQAQKHPVCIQQGDAVNKQGNGCHIAQQGQQQYRHGIFRIYRRW